MLGTNGTFSFKGTDFGSFVMEKKQKTKEMSPGFNFPFLHRSLNDI